MKLFVCGALWLHFLWSGSSQKGDERLRGEMGEAWEGEFAPTRPCGGRAWSLHAWINTIKSALALSSPSLPPSPSAALPFPPHDPPPNGPHRCIIVSGRATRLVDTQPGERGAMMNCSLLVLSMMIIINFPLAPAGEWGPESCSIAEPPLVGRHGAHYHHLSKTAAGPKAKCWWKWKALTLICKGGLFFCVCTYVPRRFKVIQKFEID